MPQDVTNEQNLTQSQRRLLGAIRATGTTGKIYNDRARRPLQTLEAAGLITVRWDSRAQSKGSGIELVGHNTAWPVEPRPKDAR